MLEVGTKAPEFELPDQNGELHKLSDYRGSKVILYFYSKDNTAGCTKQACAYSELMPHFREKGAVVLGVRIVSPPISALKRNTHWALHCSQIPIERQSKHMMSGTRRNSMARSLWV